MNILLFALGSHGDVHPFVGIGIRLRERGHQVAVAANEYFKPLVEHAQLEFIQCGTADEYTQLATNPELWHPTRSMKAVFGGTARYLRPMYEIARDFAQRDDAVIATGRSDYPNQVNNVLCFPFIFRGALDVGATCINEEMKLAAAQAIAEVIPPDHLAADYIIPSVFDRDVAPAVAAAVAEAAERSGVARKPRKHRGGRAHAALS